MKFDADGLAEVLGVVLASLDRALLSIESYPFAALVILLGGLIFGSLLRKR